MKKKKKKKVKKKNTREKKKKKGFGEIFALVFIILIITFSFFIADYVITGKIVTSVPYVCKDNDGKDFFKEGEVELYNVMNDPFIEKVFHDYCSGKETLVEYYCEWENSNNVAKAEEKICELGCYNGACIIPRAPESENIFTKI